MALAMKASQAVQKMEDGDNDKLMFETSEGIEPIMSFEEMQLKDNVLRGIYDYGFVKPSDIQMRALMPIIKGRDVIAQAQSGTGKTSMLAITVCHMVDTSSKQYVQFNLKFSY